MLEVESPEQHGRMATRIAQNVIEVEKLSPSIYMKIKPDTAMVTAKHKQEVMGCRCLSFAARGRRYRLMPLTFHYLLLH